MTPKERWKYERHLERVRMRLEDEPGTPIACDEYVWSGAARHAGFVRLTQMRTAVKGCEEPNWYYQEMHNNRISAFLDCVVNRPGNNGIIYAIYDDD